MRNAACSWARATIRSASSWAFSMIRSPSALIRLAARTSSGTATRSSSMRPSAAFWSTTTFVVSGSFLPLAMSDSRRSTRKMMSIGVPSRLAAGAVARGWPQVWHADVRVSALASASREGRPRRPAGTIVETSPPNAGDLLDQARADVAVLDRGHEEDGVDVGREDPVVVGELHLGLEVADGPQAADDRAGAAGAAEVDRQAVERVDLDPAERARRPRSRASRMTAIRVSTASSGALRGLARTATMTVSKTAAARRDDVEVAVGDRVERAGIDRDRVHRSSARR